MMSGCGSEREGRFSLSECGRNRARQRGASSLTIVFALLLVVAIGAAAWWFLGRPATKPAAAPAAGTPAAAAADGTAVAEDAAPPIEELSVNELYKQARSAMSEGRMTAPPGNNALEYYLRIQARQPDDNDAVDALRELFPFASGSAEDQINQGNFDEANRIIGLLAKADPSNYTLTILRSKLDAKKKQSERDQQLAQQAAAAAAAKAANGSAASTPAAATPEAAPADSAPVAAAPAAPAQKPAAEVARATPPPAPARTPAPAPEPPVGETRDVRVVTAPRPNYPAAAVRNRQDGWVEVEFTVAADGSVQNAHVVSSRPPRVFDEEALAAIQAAKFEPRLYQGTPIPSTLRRRIEFKLNN